MAEAVTAERDRDNWGDRRIELTARARRRSFRSRYWQQLFAYPLHLLARPRLVGLGQIHLDVFALPDVVDAGEAEACKGVLDRLALRVKNPRLQRNFDARFHVLPGE